MVKIVLTFDDNKWNHYHTVFPLLKKYNFKATFAYITKGTYIYEDQNNKAIQEMLDYGIEICSHSHSHLKFDYAVTKPKELINDLIQNEKNLKKHNIHNFGIIIPYNYLKIPKSFFNLFSFKYVVYETSTIDNYHPNPKKQISQFTKESNLNKFNIKRIEFPLDNKTCNDVNKFYDIIKNLKDDDICVIMFHNISTYCKDINVKTDTFEELLIYLKKNNYEVTTLKKLYNFN